MHKMILERLDRLDTSFLRHRLAQDTAQYEGFQAGTNRIERPDTSAINSSDEQTLPNRKGGTILDRKLRHGKDQLTTLHSL